MLTCQQRKIAPWMTKLMSWQCCRWLNMKVHLYQPASEVFTDWKTKGPSFLSLIKTCSCPFNFAQVMFEDSDVGLHLSVKG